ncbi:MAG: ATP synthase F0 subunit B [Myxococcaceae bacterium]|nr:ATP synthase F0 subunit B [Myxococcaceae bacterium]MBH2006161.1 ATP synthase F0 subunit B [Myxococcaceae bacterium]
MLNWWGIGPSYRESPAIGWVLLTFAIFLFLLYRFARTPLRTYLEDRSNRIRTAIQEAQIAREDAARKLSQYESRLAELDAEIASMKLDFQNQGKQEQARLQEEAEKIAELIRTESQETLKAEILRTVAKLKRDLAEKVLGSALEHLKLDPEHEPKRLAHFIRESRMELKK